MAARTEIDTNEHLFYNENMTVRQEALTLEEAADLLGTSRPTFYRWLQEGKVRGARIGRKWTFQRSDLEALLDPPDPLSQRLLEEMREAIRHYERLGKA